MPVTTEHWPEGHQIAIGDAIPALELALTPTHIVAGAIASRDFMPAHHDPVYAKAQGAADIFMNILTTNGYMSRLLTDWAGPQAMVKNIKIRLGVPAIPNQVLRFSGEVLNKSRQGDEFIIEVAIKAVNDLGDHATGTALVTLPTEPD